MCGLVAYGYMYNTRQLFYINFDFTYIVLLESYICWEIKKNSDNSKLKRSISMESEKTWKEQGQEAKKHKD